MEQQITVNTRLQPKLPAPHHIASRTRLYVKAMTGGEILGFWLPPNNVQLELDEVYLVQANSIGMIDWKKTTVWKPLNLVGTDNVFVFKPPKDHYT